MKKIELRKNYETTSELLSEQASYSVDALIEMLKYLELTNNYVIRQNGDGFYIKKTKEAIKEFIYDDILDDNDTAWYDIVVDESGKRQSLTSWFFDFENEKEGE